MKTAVIILNRNLPNPTNRLCEYFLLDTKSELDVFVVEAGSEDDKLSKYCTWHVNDPVTRVKGLRFNRGMNYALVELLKAGRFNDYDAFLFCTNDTEYTVDNAVDEFTSTLMEHPSVGVLVPCANDWGERLLLQELPTKYFWSAYSCSFVVTRALIERIGDFENPDYLNFLFDGTNFRGFMSETEIIVKGYANDFATAITANVTFIENKSHLIEKNDLIKTESNRENLELYVKEGHSWLRKKYGFNSRWAMHAYSKGMYDDFFSKHSHLKKFKI